MLGNNFEEKVANFERVNANDAKERLENEQGTIVFVGRPTCGFCRKFVNTLEEAQSEKELTVYYVNSEDPEDITNVQELREQYGVPTVPGLLYAGEEGVSVRCDSSMSVDEIHEFVEAR